MSSALQFIYQTRVPKETPELLGCAIADALLQYDIRELHDWLHLQVHLIARAPVEGVLYQQA